MKKVFAYIRVSTVRQGSRGTSLKEQQTAIRAHAARHSLTITEWFEEQETAAKRGRPVFTRMLGHLKRGQVTGVIVHKIDRSTRNLRDWADLGELIDKGIELHIAHESLDLSSRGGRLSADILAVIAADDIRNRREEVKKGFYGRLKQGIYPLPAPIGYIDQGSGKPKTPDPTMGPLVRRTFELYATRQYNFRELGDEIYWLGLRNRRGGRVTRNGISKLLNNEFYIGTIYIARTGERFSGKHEPLVSSSLFREVQAILNGRKPHKNLKHEHAYRRQIRCASCGYSLRGELQKGRVYYRCHTRTCPTTCLRETAVDEAIRKIIGSVTVPQLMADELIQEIAGELANAQSQIIEASQDARLHLGKIESKLERLTDAYVDRVLDREMFLNRQSALHRDREKVLENLNNIGLGIAPQCARVEKFVELLKTLCLKHELTSQQEKHQLAKSIASNFRASGKNILFDLNFGFDLLSKWSSDYCSIPYRDTGRTFSMYHSVPGQRPYVPMSTKELAKALFRQLQKDAETGA